MIFRPSPQRSRRHCEAQEYSAEKFPTLGVVQERWRAVEHGARGYLATLREGMLAEPLSYTNLKGEAGLILSGRRFCTS